MSAGATAAEESDEEEGGRSREEQELEEMSGYNLQVVAVDRWVGEVLPAGRAYRRGLGSVSSSEVQAGRQLTRQRGRCGHCCLRLSCGVRLGRTKPTRTYYPGQTLRVSITGGRVFQCFFLSAYREAYQYSIYEASRQRHTHTGGILTEAADRV